MSFKDNWKMAEFRQPYTTKINSVIEKYSHLIPFKKSAADIEESIFNYSKTQDEYSNKVEKILQRIEFLLDSETESTPPPLKRNLSLEEKKAFAFWSRPPCNLDKNAFRRVYRHSPSSSAPVTPSSSPPASEHAPAEDTQNETVINAKVVEIPLPDTVNDVELEPEEDGFVLIPKKTFSTFETIFAGQSPERDANVNLGRMTRSCVNFEETPILLEPEDDLKVWVEFLEHKLRKITDPKKLCIVKHKIDQILFEDEIEQCKVEISEVERKRSEEVWKTEDFRKIVADKIEEVKAKYDIHCIKSSTELEQDEFIKSETKAEYMSYVTELMLRLLDSNDSNRSITRQTDAVRAVTLLLTDLSKLALKKPDD